MKESLEVLVNEYNILLKDLETSQDASNKLSRLSSDVPIERMQSALVKRFVNLPHHVDDLTKESVVNLCLLIYSQDSATALELLEQAADSVSFQTLPQILPQRRTPSVVSVTSV